MWDHLVGFELSFLEKLGWLLKEAKRPFIGRPTRLGKGQQKPPKIHGFANTRRQELIGERLAINVVLKIESRLQTKKRKNKTQNPPPQGYLSAKPRKGRKEKKHSLTQGQALGQMKRKKERKKIQEQEPFFFLFHLCLSANTLIHITKHQKHFKKNQEQE